MLLAPASSAKHHGVDGPLALLAGEHDGRLQRFEKLARELLGSP
jgi:hypothetical protein